MTMASSLFSYRRFLFLAVSILGLSLSLSSAWATTQSNDPGFGPVIPPSPPYQLSPANLTFTDIPVGQASAVQTMTFTNNSPSALSEVMVTLDSTNTEFTQQSTCTTLAPGENCQINVTFTPSAEGSKSTTLSLSFKHSVPTGAVMISLGGFMSTSVTEMFLVSLNGNGLSTSTTPDPGSTSTGDGSETPAPNNSETGGSGSGSGGGCALSLHNSQQFLTMNGLVLYCLIFLIFLRKTIRSKSAK